MTNWQRERQHDRCRSTALNYTSEATSRAIKTMSRAIETMSRAREMMSRVRETTMRGHGTDEGRGKAEKVSGRLGTTGCCYSLVMTG